MNILGLSGYAHDASAALLVDGKLVSMVEEERLNREKHTWKFPKNAISSCLKEAKLNIEDIDYFTFFWMPSKELTGNLIHFVKYFPDSVNLLKATSDSQALKFTTRLKSMYNLGQTIKNEFNLSYVPDIQFVEHHLAHAASAFFVSPYEDAAILTMDGRGESTTTLLATGHKNKIKKIKEIKVPHSLGHVYAAITDYLGFRPFSDEWKVMGMSAYGKNIYAKEFNDMIHLLDDGTFRLNLKYFKFHTHGQNQWVSDLFIEKLGPKRNYKDSYDQRHYDIACSFQKVIENAGVHVAKHLYEITKLPNLCMTGGVVLNCLMNKRIVEETPFKEFFFQPIANDAGASLGSSLYFNHQILDKPRNFVFDTVFFGPEFSAEKIEDVLIKAEVEYRRCDNIAKETAPYVAQGKVVGWFQGRMEAGPRALGNRSIIASPVDSSMKDKINKCIKKREHFRPFAPAVLEEKVSEYFKMPKDQLSPYMIMIGDVREDKKDVIPAITHADGTARPQTISRKNNPRYWDLISEFEKLTGVAVIVNTSFNENEPIVCTPQEAVDCFLRTELDVLAIGDFLVEK
jgi:carbamoyltransferase